MSLRLLASWCRVSNVLPVDGSAPFYSIGEEPQGTIMYTPDAR
jgi:hypothetical protein